MTLKVRTGVEANAPAVASIHVRAWRSAYAGIVNADYFAVYLLMSGLRPGLPEYGKGKCLMVVAYLWRN
jgi:hypothetical protein